MTSQGLLPLRSGSEQLYCSSASPPQEETCLTANRIFGQARGAIGIPPSRRINAPKLWKIAPTLRLVKAS
jgi:hypothetical protein